MGRNLNSVSQCTISYGASKDLILVYTVQLKPMIKAHSSGRINLKLPFHKAGYRLLSVQILNSNQDSKILNIVQEAVM